MPLLVFIIFSLLFSTTVYAACPCTSPSAPLCVQNSCYPCRTDDDCTSFTGKPYCSNGTCKSCNEFTHIGCSLTLPYCLSGICTTCSGNTSVCQLVDKNAGLSSITHVFCDTNNVCKPNCVQDSVCLLPDFPTCNLVTGTCTSECIDDSNCARFSDHTKCILGKCRACYVDTDCPSGTICSQAGSTKYRCVECEPETSRGCTEISKPLCVQLSDSATYCSDCLLDADCENNVVMNSRGLTLCDNVTHQCNTPYYGALCNSSTPCADPAASWCRMWVDTGNTRCYYCLYDLNCLSFQDRPNCYNGTCVSCSTNDHCSDISLPRCEPTLLQCTKCIANSDCARFFPRSACKYIDPTDLSTSECVQCAKDLDCNKNYTDGVCQPDFTCTGLEECTVNDCNTVIKPLCDISAGYCRRCESDADCAAKFTIEQYCNITDTDNNTCVQCLTDDHCDGTQGFVCGSDKTCITKPCAVKADCVPVIPECSDQFLCVRCSSASQCKAWHVDVGYDCDLTTGECFLSPNACYSPDQCTNPALAYCDNGICRACQIDGECGSYDPLLKVCVENVCYGCNTHEDCADPHIPVCTNNECVGCSDNSNCSRFEVEIHCDPITNQCRECLDNSHCLQMTNSRCDTTTGTCSPCQTAADCTQFPRVYQCSLAETPATCSNCVTDADCPLQYTDGTCNALVCGAQSLNCTHNTDCTTSSYPICDGSYCRRCTSDSECSSQFWYWNKCYQPPDGQNQCVECLSTSDCDVANGESCDPITMECVGVPCTTRAECEGLGIDRPNCVYGRCKACVYDSQCRSWNNDSFYSCNIADGACSIPTPLCTANSECPVEYPKCKHFDVIDEHHCANCTEDSECARFDETPRCNNGNPHICGECFLPGDLCQDPTKSKCDESSNTCVPCDGDSTCTHITGMKRCISGACYPCSANADCTTESASRCVTGIWDCGGCLNDNDCTHISGKPYCTAGVCTECKSNSHCTNSSNSKCVSGTCSPCEADNDCTQIANLPTCQDITGTNKCYQCRSNTDCPPEYTGNFCQTDKTCRNGSPSCTSSAACTTPNYPSCNTAIKRCVRCLSDSECLNKFGSSRPYCRSVNNLMVCSQCLTGEDCPVGQICNNQGTCQNFVCNSKTDCLSADPALPECYNKKCVKCNSTSMCRTLNGNLVMYACNLTTGACYNGGVPCDTITECTSPEFPACLANVCSPCISDPDCSHIGSGDQQFCRIDLGGVCKQCFLSIDCIDPSKAACATNGTCVPCSSNYDCQALFASKGKPICAPTTKTCVQCVSNSHCRDPLKPICNPSTQQCIGCQTNSDCLNPQLPVCDSNKDCTACKTQADCNAFFSVGRIFCSPSGCTKCMDGADLCTSCPYGYYLNRTDQLCRPKIPVSLTLAEDQPPLQYKASFNYSFDETHLPFSTENIQLSSSNGAIFTYKFVNTAPQSLIFGVLSFSEDEANQKLFVSFTQWNHDQYETHMIVSENSSISFPDQEEMLKTAKIAGLTAQTAVITTSAVSFIGYLKSKGYSSYLMRFLILMSQINFLKLINVNFPTSLAIFFDSMDLEQFGIPNYVRNIFNVPEYEAKSTRRMLQSSVNSTVTTSITFNTYHTFGFSTIFLETYGGILVSSITMLLLYFFCWMVSCCIKEKKLPRFKGLLRSVLEMMEKNVLTTLLMSRYQYLILAIFLNFMYRPLSNSYEITSFVIASIYTVMIIVGILACIRAALKNGFWEKKSAVVAYFTKKVDVLFSEYEDTALGRTVPAVNLIYNLFTMVIIAMLQNWPAVQIILMLSNNIVAVTLFCCSGVFKSSCVKFMAISAETGLFLITLCLLSIYSLQFETTTHAYNSRVIFGWVSVTIVGVTILVHVAAKLIEVLSGIIKKIRERKKKKAEDALKNRRKSNQLNSEFATSEIKIRTRDTEFPESSSTLNPKTLNTRFETRGVYMNDDMNSSQIAFLQTSNVKSYKRNSIQSQEIEIYRKEIQQRKKALRENFRNKQLEKEKGKVGAKKVSFLNSSSAGEETT